MSLPFPCRLLLNRDIAVPTKHNVASEAKDTPVTPETPRYAFEKRERARVLQEILHESIDIALQDKINSSEDDGANATSARMVSKAIQLMDLHQHQ